MFLTSDRIDKIYIDIYCAVRSMGGANDEADQTGHTVGQRLY